MERRQQVVGTEASVDNVKDTSYLKSFHEKDADIEVAELNDPVIKSGATDGEDDPEHLFDSESLSNHILKTSTASTESGRDICMEEKMLEIIHDLQTVNTHIDSEDPDKTLNQKNLFNHSVQEISKLNCEQCYYECFPKNQQKFLKKGCA